MAKKPNILILMSDHMRGDAVLPHTPAIMPNAGKLAREGVTFTNAFCPSPHCSPSRATFWTGLYPTQHGVWNNVNVSNTLSRGLFDGVRCWSEEFDPNEYRMRFHGKWHVSDYEQPWDRGFERPESDTKQSVPPANRPDPYEWERDYVHWKDRGWRWPGNSFGKIERSGYPPYFLYGISEDDGEHNVPVEEAMAFLDGPRDPDKAWCLFLSLSKPHDPYVPAKRFLDMYRDVDIQLPRNFEDRMEDKPAFYRRTRGIFDKVSREDQREAVRHFWACCTQEDYHFGRVLDALDRSGEADNTLVIYTSDHGDYAGEHGLWAKGLPCFRGAYHVPLVVRWPKGIESPGRTVDAMVTLADLAPTLLQVAGYTSDRAFAGRSLVSFLKGRTPKAWRTEFYTQSNGNELYGIQRSVSTAKWKLVYNGFDFDELYDLENDPDEMVNVFDRPGNEGVIRELYEKLWRFAYEHGDTCMHPYIMVGLAKHGPGVAFGQP
jgi:arylsulfatase A-like enzyme